jgi:hypothetical protein
MRHAIHATAAVITLACTGGAMAQWCYPDFPEPWLVGWCGANRSWTGPIVTFDRATDAIRLRWIIGFSNLRGPLANGGYGPVFDVLYPEEMLYHPGPRSCTGMTTAAVNRNFPCCYWYYLYGGGPGGQDIYVQNCDVSCEENFLDFTFQVPPAQPGRFWLSYEPCPGAPGMKHAVVRTSTTAPGSNPNYAVEVERTVVAGWGAGGDLLGSRSTFSLGANDSAAPGNCFPDDGSYRRTAIYRIRETCNGSLYNSSLLTVHETATQELGGQTTTEPSYGTVRNTISTRLNRRGNFRVRSPSAVMGVRGLTAAETVLEGYAEDPSLQVRWQRILDAAEPQNGIVPVELLADGPLVGGSSVTGTQGPVLRLTGFTEHDAGTYLMRVIPAGGTIDDAEIVTAIRVVDDVGQPFFTEEPRTRTVCPSQISADTPISFTAPAVATANDPNDPIVYQWYVNSEMVPEGPKHNSPGDAIWVAGTAGPQLDITQFVLGGGTDIHNVVFWLECEAMNSHGSSRTRPIPFVIDIDTDDCDDDGTTDACEIADGATDANDDGIPDACQCLADIDGDGLSDGADLAQLLSQWGPAQPNGVSTRCDANADGMIDGADLAGLLGSWGACGG